MNDPDPHRRTFAMRTITTCCLALAVMAATVCSARAQEEKKQYEKPGDMKIDPKKTYTATIDTSEGKIVAQLFPDKAPQTVNSFVFLAKEHFYDGVPFHRIIKGFMIQGGDPTGTGMGGPGYRFADEKVQRRYERGIVAMANAGPNTNGSQFFICHGRNSEGLPPSYTIFGKVTD